MSSKLLRLFLIPFLIVGLFSTVSANTRTYEDDRGAYVLELPSSSWRVVKLNGITHQRTEFVNGRRSPVLLRIRKVYPGTSPSSLVRQQRGSDSRLLPGYMLVKDQPFEGRLSGSKYSYEYVKGGISRVGVNYYLQADDGFVYALQFNGPRNRMRELREEMDFIARSFWTELSFMMFTTPQRGN